MSENVYLLPATPCLAQSKSVWTLFQWESPRYIDPVVAGPPACGCRREFHQNSPPPPRQWNSWPGPGLSRAAMVFSGHSHPPTIYYNISLRSALPVKMKMKKVEMTFQPRGRPKELPKMSVTPSGLTVAPTVGDLSASAPATGQGENQGTEKHCMYRRMGGSLQGVEKGGFSAV